MGLRQPEGLQKRHLSKKSPGKVYLQAGSLLLAGLAALGLTGCEDSSRKPVAAHHPVPIPAVVTLPNLGLLPLNSVRRHVLSVAPAMDGVELLARQAQAALEAAEQDFQRGDLSGSRLEFGEALAFLQQSGFDVQAEPRLATLFNDIVETAHNYEAMASAEAAANGGGGQSGAPGELSGIGFSSEGIPEGPVDPRLRTSAEGEVADLPHDLPLTVNDSVLAFLNFFTKTTKGRAVVETGLRRAGRYRPMIQRVLREQGLPSDLMYMAQAESAFQPQALSSAGARGLWQFMSFRGEEYGLEHSFWVDDRQDPEKATEAAAHHLRDLYDMFGDWYLAMAAYDSGPGAVMRAVERTGYADFWELYKRNVLPKETRNYVPIILSLTLIAKDPSRYGIEVAPDQPFRTDTVVLTHPIDLRLVADTIDVDVDTLRSLNPQMLRMVTPAVSSFTLHLPEGTADQFNSAMEDIAPDKWLTWRRHIILAGETLPGIAAKYHLTAASIADANDVDDVREPLEVGDKLIIPLAAQPLSGPGKIVRYRVRTSDTMQSIADEFDVSAADLKKWNHLRSNRLVRGARLTIYPGGAAPPATASAAPAGHAETVSAKLPVKSSGSEAVAVAEVRPAAKPGVKAAAKPENSADIRADAAAEGKPVVHRVQPGETLVAIARSYNTTVAALRARNRFLLSRSLQAGDVVTILPAR